MSTNCRAVAVVDLGEFSKPGSLGLVSRFAERHLGGLPLAVRIARRLSDCAQIDQVYLVGGNLPGTLLRAGCAGIRTINMPNSHLCQRLCAAADESGADWVVYVTGNRPFVDSTLIDQLLAIARRQGELDYVGYCSGGGDCRRMEQLGLAGEACHADTLRRLRRNVDRLSPDRGGSIVSYLEDAPGAYHLKLIPVPMQLDRDDLRFAVEDESDWDDAQLLCETINDEESQWQQLMQLVMGNEWLRESMATRNS